MIKSFKHKGLKQLYGGKTKGVKAEHVPRLRLILAVLNAATIIEDIQSIRALSFHTLSGSKKNAPDAHAVTVNKNWRVTFEFENGDVTNVNYEDYH